MRKQSSRGECTPSLDIKIAIAFENEVGPTVESIEARVDELQAWIDAKYAEWRRILEELHEIETKLE